MRLRSVCLTCLPSGYSYVSDDGGGAYVAPTWTIGDLANGSSATLNVTALVLASGDYDNYAQVATSDQSDPDSTPGDDSVDQDDDDTATTTPVAVAVVWGSPRSMMSIRWWRAPT